MRRLLPHVANERRLDLIQLALGASQQLMQRRWEIVRMRPRNFVQFRFDAGELVGQDGFEQIDFARKMGIKRFLADAQFRGQIVHGHAAKPMTEKMRSGRLRFVGERHSSFEFAAVICLLVSRRLRSVADPVIGVEPFERKENPDESEQHAEPIHMRPFGRGNSDLIEVIWNGRGKKNQIARNEVSESQGNRSVHCKEITRKMRRKRVLPEENDREQDQNFVNRPEDVETVSDRHVENNLARFESKLEGRRNLRIDDRVMTVTIVSPEPQMIERKRINFFMIVSYGVASRSASAPTARRRNASAAPSE